MPNFAQVLLEHVTQTEWLEEAYVPLGQTLHSVVSNNDTVPFAQLTQISDRLKFRKRSNKELRLVFLGPKLTNCPALHKAVTLIFTVSPTKMNPVLTLDAINETTIVGAIVFQFTSTMANGGIIDDD